MRARAGDIVVGLGTPVPTLGGRAVPFVNLDNMATTPAFHAVVAAVDEILPYHASVHGGTGYKSRACAEALEDAAATIGSFVGADPSRDVVVFTDSLADAIALVDGDVVLTTDDVGSCPDGTIDLDDLHRKVAWHAGRGALFVAASASEVTGVVQPIHDIAARVHAAGGRILVDASHLAAHRPIDMLRHRDARHLDFVALAGHQMYAPFGGAALIGSGEHVPAAPRTANVIGAVALAAAARTLDDLGRERTARHEAALLGQATDRLANVRGLHLHAPSPRDVDRIAVVPFTLDGVDHGLVAAILDHEHAIGVHRGAVFVGASFGCYSDPRDVHRLVGALHRIAAGEIAGRYRLDGRGDWQPMRRGDVSSVA